MTRQDIFDKIYRHLLKQNKKAARRRTRNSFTGDMIDGDCLYRTKKGLQCAVGCLIDDDNYSPQLEGRGFDANSVKQAILRSNKGIQLNPRTKDMLLELQAIHDAYSPDQWSGRLYTLSKDYNLKIPA